MGNVSTFTHLTLSERERIGVYAADGKACREIAILVGRHHTTISRELRRNRQPHPQMQGYIGCYAQQEAHRRKKTSGKRPRLKNETIRNYVESKMQIGWSPEQVANRLPIDQKGACISTEAIYQYVYSEWTEGIIYLARRHPKRYQKNYARRRKKPPIMHRVCITQRPKSIDKRRQYGHWESDSVESDQSKVSINVLHERVTRLVKITQIPDKKAQTNKAAIVSRLLPLPFKARRSLTYDNGPENYSHEQINKILGTRSYFCQPYHSWEKGAVENTNGLLRRFIPKKTDLSLISQDELSQIECLLNNRPRKCLRYKTPLEVFIKKYGAVPC